MVPNFHHLARGIIIDGEKVLVAHAIGHKNTFLPGGHVEFGESAKDALIREIKEEVGLSCRINDFLGLVEHKWEKDQELHCEINQTFIVDVPGLDATKAPPSNEPHIEFYWASINELDLHNLQPYPLRKLIQRYVSGDKLVWWESTLNQELHADNKS
jgi:8-oxo-dGTP diphosphatase